MQRDPRSDHHPACVQDRAGRARHRAGPTALVAGLILLCAREPRARADGYDPVPTRGLRYTVALQANIMGMLIGRPQGYSRETYDHLGLGMFGANVDVRGYPGPVVLGLSGDLQWGIIPGNEGTVGLQLVDLHIGLGIKVPRLADYRVRIGAERISSTAERVHYRVEKQGSAVTHQLTTGPRLAFTWRGGGVGAHLTYRVSQVFTRGRFGWWVDVGGAYANLNTLYNGADFPGPKRTEHAWGARVAANIFFRGLTLGCSVGYFAEAWHVQFIAVGMIFWGA